MIIRGESPFPWQTMQDQFGCNSHFGRASDILKNGNLFIERLSR